MKFCRWQVFMTDWVENNTGEVFSTFSIITTEANDLMANIHNSGKRMPAS